KKFVSVKNLPCRPRFFHLKNLFANFQKRMYNNSPFEEAKIVEETVKRIRSVSFVRSILYGLFH
ncbi:MAG: hypothetical protein LBG77_04350, partial [Dysgonamonadaceae bacterium]|nr:hypothetical protein [Dysgonamonadaceae bacterium]